MTNIQEHLPKALAINGLKTLIKKHVASKQVKWTIYTLTLTDIEKITKLVQEKYADPEWIYMHFVPALSF